jgi:hypothetical protein
LAFLATNCTHRAGLDRDAEETPGAAISRANAYHRCVSQRCHNPEPCPLLSRPPVACPVELEHPGACQWVWAVGGPDHTGPLGWLRFRDHVGRHHHRWIHARTVGDFWAAGKVPR